MALSRPMIRLNKYMAECGVGSRRACDALIAAGRVYVNGSVRTELGIRIDQEQDKVKVDGRVLRPEQHYHYLVLNKPKNVITTASDERQRKTVLTLVPSFPRLFPVGRLDKETTGLLLLTNDGNLAYRLTHPKFEIEKVYEVLLAKKLSMPDARTLESGIELEEGITSPSQISFPDQGNRRLLQITLHQGWKRQVRRMFACLGYRVIHLKRVAIGALRIGDLQEGSWRNLTPGELRALRRQVGF